MAISWIATCGVAKLIIKSKKRDDLSQFLLQIEFLHQGNLKTDETVLIILSTIPNY